MIRKHYKHTASLFLALTVLLGTISSLAYSETLLQSERKSAAQDYGYAWPFDGEKRARFVNSREDLIKAVNAGISMFEDSFVLTIQNYHSSILPESLYELEAYFLESIRFQLFVNFSGMAKVRVQVAYNEGGKLLRAHKRAERMPEDMRVQALHAAVMPILDQCAEMTEWEKACFFHDTLVANTRLDTESYVNNNTTTAYTALVEKKGTDESYAQALQLLFGLVDMENRVVYARLNGKNSIPHLFNKVRIDGEWYNISATLDERDVTPNNATIAHGYFLVNDKVIAQRYNWEESRYPHAEGPSNAWYAREGGAVTSQAQLETYVAEQLAKKKEKVGVWIEDYSREKYNLSFVKEFPGVKKSQISYIGTLPTGSKIKEPISTEVLILLSYYIFEQ